MNANFITVPEENVSMSDGIELCKILYSRLSKVGIFPALTGGLLYKEGNRKDIDIVLYRHRQDLAHFETIEFSELLEECGLYDIKTFGFVTKAKWRGLVVDLFNPETSEDLDHVYGE